MRTCGATPGGPSLDGVDLKTQYVIQGAVLRAGVEDGVPNGAPVGNAYVRLLDSSGEFTAEVPTNDEGQLWFLLMARAKSSRFPRKQEPRST